jgi:hypothetical protein
MIDISGPIDISGSEYFVGEDDIDALLSGDDDDEVGRAPRRGRRSRGTGLQRRAAEVAVAQRMASSGAVVREHSYTKARTWVLPFDSVVNVPAGGTTTITSNPQMPFRGRRLSVLGSVAGFFLLNSIIVGNQPQFAALNAAGPADAFAPTAFGTDLSMDTAQANTNVSLQVTNISAAPLRFAAFIFGEAVQ